MISITDTENDSQPRLADFFDTALASSLQQGRLGDPFSLLGPRYIQLPQGEQCLRLCCYYPGASAVRVVSRLGSELAPDGVLLGCLTQWNAKEGERDFDDVGNSVDMPASANSGIFFGQLVLPAQAEKYEIPYVLHVAWPGFDGSEEIQIVEDPYAFGLLLNDFDLHLFNEGRHRHLGRCFGAQAMTIDDIDGVRFAVWAPNARRVSVIGDFNQWDGRRHPMRLRQSAGVWELFIPRVHNGALYKYEIVGADGSVLPAKADPMARATEIPPGTASRVIDDRQGWRWQDESWMLQRAERQSLLSPMSVYEVHAASWMRILEEDGRNLNWTELAARLIPYVKDMGFTHIELLPVMEYPFGGSWGYQPLSQFAPSARFGTAADFAYFVDACHAAEIGVILDWVPAHFPSDAHGLAHFDGTPLYEHSDPREGFHQDWNTLIYNLGRHEVRGFLIASALEWLEHFHVDGLRVDAVASMLYRDYSRKADEWVPNIHGGRENLEAVAFLRELNQAVAEFCPGALMIAEESTAWPGVTKPVEQGGLGFSYKWNMGWMHDTLHYVEQDGINRRYHHHDFTFGLSYAFSEAFILPISHDEVVHGKRSLLQKMPGDYWQKFATLRAYLGFMWTHPGKKLLFMGSEFGQYDEFDHDKSPQWELLDDQRHRNIQRLVRDLNRLYTEQPVMHRYDTQPDSFAWVVGNDSVNSVFAYLRCGNEGETPLLVVVNMTSVPRHDYRIGVPSGPGKCHEWEEIFNTDADIYGGGNLGNSGSVTEQAQELHGYPSSVQLTLPPLATIILRRR